MIPAPLAIATGDPAGVGPVVAARAAVACGASDRILLFGDGRRLRALVEAESGPVRCRQLSLAEAGTLSLGEVGVVDTGAVSDEIVLARQPSAEGGRAQLRALDTALAAVREGHGRALVTGPISKEAVQCSGVAFVGHTEHLARAVGLQDDEVSMLFLGPRLNVALATTHVSIAELPRALTQARVERTIGHLLQALSRLSRADAAARSRSVVVVGLNPHAGEGGLFGDEESQVIAPAIATSQAEAQRRGFVLHGPAPAETAFRQAAAGEHAGVVAMFHDQATIASKLLDWGQAVNVTWGLPFVRTSVDHGVGYQAMREGRVEAEGMSAALRMAQRLTD